MVRFGHVNRHMRTTQSMRRQATALAAVFMLLVQVLMPFGQALAFDVGQDIEYQIICTPTGVQQIPIGVDGAPIAPQDMAPCPFCFVSNAPPLFTPEVAPFLIVTDEVGHEIFTQAFDRNHTNVWRGAPHPSRAPPRFV